MDAEGGASVPQLEALRSSIHLLESREESEQRSGGLQGSPTEGGVEPLPPLRIPVLLPSRPGGAPRTLYPGQSLVSATEVNNPGACLLNIQPIVTEEGGTGVYSEATIQQAKQLKKGHWNVEEEELLEQLCSKYSHKVQWSEVMKAYEQRYQPRTKAALAAKWSAIKKQRLSGQQRLSSSNVLQRTEAEPTTADDISLEGVEHLKENLGERHDSLNDPCMSRNQELVTDERNIKSQESALSKVKIPEAFRKSFMGYYHWASKSFNRITVRKGPKEYPKALLEMADDLINEMWMRPLEKNQSRVGRLNALVYAAARTIHQVWTDERSKNRQNTHNWIRRKAKEVFDRERLIRLITHELERRHRKKAPTVRDQRIIQELGKCCGTRSTSMLLKRLEHAKQELALVRNRISLREQEIQRKMLRKRFAKNPSLQVLIQYDSKENKSNVQHGRDNQPNMNAVLDFWKAVIGKPKFLDVSQVEELQTWRECQKAAYSSNVGFSKSELGMIYEEEWRRSRPFKAAGPDGIHAYWWKHLPSAGKLLGNIIVDWLVTGKVSCRWLMRGRTVLIPKKGDLRLPQNYRPITCLNTCYKLLTATIAKALLRHLDKGEAIPQQQRALRKKEWGCTHAILLDRAVATDAIMQKRCPLSVAWLDFKKAFDSLSHSYIRWILESVNAPKTITATFFKLMAGWETRYELKYKTKRGYMSIQRSQPVKIANGIFQGDALSPLLFILSVSPISFALENKAKPYRSSVGQLSGKGFSLGHQFYVDDLKIYAPNRRELVNALVVAKKISTAIGLDLNVGKCAQAHYTPNVQELEVETLGDEEPLMELPVLGLRQSYRYLGIDQKFLATKNALQRFEESLFSRASTIFRSNLTWRQMSNAFQSIALGGLRYGFLNTSGAGQKLSEALKHARDIDVRIRSLLSDSRCRFQKSITHRLYISRELGGYGLKSVESLLEDTLVATFAYLALGPGLAPQYHLFASHASRGKRTPLSDGQKILAQYGIAVEINSEQRLAKVENQSFSEPTPFLRCLRSKLQQLRDRTYFEQWKRAPMAGRFPRNAEIDYRLSCLWIKAALLSAINLRNAFAVQEGNLLAHATPAGGKLGQNKLCRHCNKDLETVAHIVSNCPKWLPNLYIHRHDSVARNIYYALCVKYGLPIVHYSNQIPPVVENEKAKLLWNMEIRTKATLFHRRPDITVFDKEGRHIMIIEVAVSSMYGMRQQHNIKFSRYTINSLELENETNLPYPPGPNLVGDLQDTYQQEVRFYPLIVGVCGEHLAETPIYLSEILGFPPSRCDDIIERMSRSAVIGTSRIVKAHFSS